MRIYLVGMPGVGKTTIGKRIAKRYGFAFYDLDEIIANTNATSITELFAAYGEDRFRQMETEALHNTLFDHNAVIATGGGTPCFNQNMSWMNEHGLSIYLNASVSFIYNRLSGASHRRPLLQNKSETELRKWVETNLQLREPFYSRAKLKLVLPVKDLKNALESIGLADLIRDKQ